jgi:hypothetical protein
MIAKSMTARSATGATVGASVYAGSELGAAGTETGATRIAVVIAALATEPNAIHPIA